MSRQAFRIKSLLRAWSGDRNYIKKNKKKASSWAGSEPDHFSHSIKSPYDDNVLTLQATQSHYMMTHYKSH